MVAQAKTATNVDTACVSQMALRVESFLVPLSSQTLLWLVT